MAPAAYEVRVAGVVPEQALRDLGAVTMAAEPTTTTLYGEIADEAALFGLLGRLRDLGIEVLDVHRVPALEPVSDGADQPATSGPGDDAEATE
jgi:hypothetical protein